MSYDEYTLKERIAHKERVRTLLEKCNNDIKDLTIDELIEYSNIMSIRLMFCQIHEMDGIRWKKSVIDRVIRVKQADFI